MYPLCQLNRPNIVFALRCGKPFYKEEQQECCSSLWHLAVWFHSHSGWGLPGELINIHFHLIFMERINTVFVWNPIGNTKHRKQQYKIRATQFEQYTLFIENRFILASVRLQFMINLKLYTIRGQLAVNETWTEKPSEFSFLEKNVCLTHTLRYDIYLSDMTVLVNSLQATKSFLFSLVSVNKFLMHNEREMGVRR